MAGAASLFNLFYPDRADFVGIVSNFRSRAAMRRLAATFRANTDFPLETTAMLPFVPGISWSDHRSFWRQGYRAVMITDTAFYRYRHYSLTAAASAVSSSPNSPFGIDQLFRSLFRQNGPPG